MINEVHLDKMNEVSFRQLSAYSMTNCVEDKVVLIDSLSRLPFGKMKEGIIAADFIALLFCTEGYLEMNMDGRRYKLCKGDILFCSRGVVLYDIMMSTSCRGKILCLSWEYGQRLFLRSTCRWDSILQLRHNPLLRPNACEQELYRAYYQLFAAKLNCYCYASDIDCIFQSFFYDLYRMTDRYALQKSRQKTSLTSFRQEDLFKRFITLLKENHSHEHFCSFYAEQLCVTPKYLSTVVKKVSGKSVSQWIDIYLIEQIKIHLKTTSLSIAEISDKLNFSNTSFFGKYVKMHTGESPTKLRRK
ncbi:MAG: helix-turn-helix domain-containing protein [Bacteroidales bacterium]|nr:helix-turn-helix domain-containing protein [Bacteroidales bacterium]